MKGRVARASLNIEKSIAETPTVEQGYSTPRSSNPSASSRSPDQYTKQFCLDDAADPDYDDMVAMMTGKKTIQDVCPYIEGLPEPATKHRVANMAVRHMEMKSRTVPGTAKQYTQPVPVEARRDGMYVEWTFADGTSAPEGGEKKFSTGALKNKSYLDVTLENHEHLLTS